MRDSDLIYILALQNVPKIGDIIAKKLIHHCGSAEAVLKEKQQNLLKIEGIGLSTISDLSNKQHLEAAAAELAFIRSEAIKCHYFRSENYPDRLKHCIDGPILLFEAGKIDLKNKHVISIVGSRKVTANGLAFCEKLVEDLAVFDPVIVSGFAYGTDITAQRAAINHGLQTIACLAHGLNQIYPKSHKKYMLDVEKHGGFFSDFWSTAKFDRNNFLKRNRLIAGISEATIVIESAEKGGSLVTADIANSYNRDVFAVPGRPTDSLSVGCNNLIKQQKAHIITTALDIPYMLNWQLDKPKQPAIQKQLFLSLNEQETEVYNYLLKQEKQTLDLIALACHRPTYRIASVLLTLELKGLIRPLPGKCFELI